MVNPRDSESLTTLCISHSSLGNGISGRDMADELNSESGAGSTRKNERKKGLMDE